jgi:hypothetical protein
LSTMAEFVSRTTRPRGRCAVWPAAGSRGSSPGPTSPRHNTARLDAQNHWTRIVAWHHPLVLQAVRLIRLAEKDGEDEAVVELPDGRRERIPLAWTDLSKDGGSTMPPLRFSPGSLRALVRLVRAHGRVPCVETDHVSPEATDLGHAASRHPQSHGGPVGGAAAPPPEKPQGLGKAGVS